MSTDSEVEVVVDMNQPEDSDTASSVHGSSFNGPRQRHGGRRNAAVPAEGARQPAPRAARQPVGTGRRPASDDNSSDTTEQPQVHHFENMAAEQRSGSEQPAQQQMQPHAAVGPTTAELQLQANQQQLQQQLNALQRLLQQSLQQKLPPAFNEPPAQWAVEQPLSAAPQQQ
eukprot:5458113-Pleurochrysis_carterae.AAC.1